MRSVSFTMPTSFLIWSAVSGSCGTVVPSSASAAGRSPNARTPAFQCGCAVAPERALCAVVGGAIVGRVRSLHRYPVKSMLGEDLDRVAVDRRGVVGDRAYALIDD